MTLTVIVFCFVCTFTLCTAVLLSASSTAAQAQAPVLPDISAWKIITSKEVGVSILMPPGTVAADAGLPYDVKKGERLVGVIFDGPGGDGDGDQTYGAVVVRANRAALEGLSAKARASGVSTKKTAIDLLYEAEFKPLIDNARGAVSDDPRRVSVTRKPLLWHGMKGEEIKMEAPAAKNQPKSFLHLRVIRNENSIYLLTAGEKSPTPTSFDRVRRFFDSFTIASGDPFARKESSHVPNRSDDSGK